MKEIKNKLAEELQKRLEVEVDENDIELPEPEHGDFAYPVMKAASKKGANPRKLAEEVEEQFENLEFIEETSVAGPGYLNIHLNREVYAEKISEQIESSRMGINRKEEEVLLEFSSPNIAKPMHIGHVRNNCLGDSLQRILKFSGYNVTSENYIGDWGAQFGKSIFAFKKYGSEEELDRNPMDHIYNLYVKFHEEAENDPEMVEKAAEWSKRLEDGDEEAKRLWKKLREFTIEYDMREYERMGIEFDRITGESKVVEEGDEIVERGIEKNVFDKDPDGSIYAEFEDEDLPSIIVRKSDGTTLYITRDIANIEKRESEGFDQNLYVVGSEQELHFQQLFKITEKFGITDLENEHISYGMLNLEEGGMSSREGNIITLSDLLDMAVKEAEKRIEDEERLENAEKIGLGAVKYANLKVSRRKDIEFNWDNVLSFEGDSGPYLQYSNTRAKSIMEKADTEGEFMGEFNETEYRLIKKIGEFPEKAENAAEQREPVKVANYLSTLCEAFNTFYHECPVLDVEEEDTKRRLKLVELFVEVTDTGLELLGIEPLEKM